MNFSERRPPTHRVRTDELEVKAKDGRTISFFGFGVQKYKLLIERELQRAEAEMAVLLEPKASRAAVKLPGNFEHPS